MKIKISQQDLLKALSFIQSIVEKKTTMPILSNVLLSAEKGSSDKSFLKLSATDLEITTVIQIPATVIKSGSTTVNAKAFHDNVRERPSGELELDVTEGERLHITSGSTSVCYINGVHADEYPSLPGISLEPDSVMRGSQLQEMIQKTVYAVSFDEARFNLNGVCFESIKKGRGKGQESVLRMVATDGHRLALIQRQVDGIEFEGSQIVPTKGLNELKRIIDEAGDGDIKVALKDGFFVVQVNTGQPSSGGVGGGGIIKVSMRLVDGEFPDYNQVIPQKEGVALSIPVQSFLSALKRASLMVTDKGKCVKLDFTTGKLRISSSSPELGEASEDVEIDYKGEHISVGFNAKYLIDFATSISDESNLIMKLSGELGPAKIYAQQDDSYFGIVMPMRLN